MKAGHFMATSKSQLPQLDVEVSPGRHGFTRVKAGSAVVEVGPGGGFRVVRPRRVFDKHWVPELAAVLAKAVELVDEAEADDPPVSHVVVDNLPRRRPRRRR